MLICVEGGRKETTPQKNTQRQKERQEKVCCGSRRRRRKKTERVSDYAILPPPSWKHRVRALSLHVLIMINAGSTTHTHTHSETTVLAGFWRGSLLGPVVLYGAVNTPVWLVKVRNHKLVKSECGWEQLYCSHRVLHSTTEGLRRTFNMALCTVSLEGSVQHHGESKKKLLAVFFLHYRAKKNLKL